MLSSKNARAHFVKCARSVWKMRALNFGNARAHFLLKKQSSAVGNTVECCLERSRVLSGKQSSVGGTSMEILLLFDGFMMFVHKNLVFIHGMAVWTVLWL